MDWLFAFFPAELTLHDWIVQGWGALGFVFYIASFQILSPRKTILAQAASQPFFMLHFWGLGFPFLAVLGLMAGMRDTVSALLDNPRLHKIIMIVNLVIVYVFAFFLAKTTGDVMGLVGATASSISQFFRGRFYAYRGLMLVHNSFWLATYIYAGSIPGGIMMVGITASNIIGVVRYRLAQFADD